MASVARSALRRQALTSPPRMMGAARFNSNSSRSQRPSLQELNKVLEETRRRLQTNVKQRMDGIRPQLQSKLTELGARWNTYSGYVEVERLKAQVTKLEHELAGLREALSVAKSAYIQAVSTRSASQRQTNDLLSRKSTWSEKDLSDYTSLLRSEHQQARDEEAAEKALEEAERQVQKGFDELMRGVMLRYHEEQIWSDRVRSASTYGSLLVVGLNAILFILAILVVEPYKRKRLAQTFEARLLEGEAQGRQLVQATIQDFDQKVDKLVTGMQSLGAAQDAMLQHAGLVRQEEGIAQDPVAADAAEDVAATRSRIIGMDKTEQQVVLASTIGIVAGAGLSLLLGACWS